MAMALSKCSSPTPALSPMGTVLFAAIVFSRCIVIGSANDFRFNVLICVAAMRKVSIMG